MLLTEKIAIVTGIGTGMGKVIAPACAKRAPHVVGAEINEGHRPANRGRVSAHDRRGLFVKTDMDGWKTSTPWSPPPWKPLAD